MHRIKLALITITLKWCTRRTSVWIVTVWSSRKRKVKKGFAGTRKCRLTAGQFLPMLATTGTVSARKSYHCNVTHVVFIFSLPSSPPRAIYPHRTSRPSEGDQITPCDMYKPKAPRHQQQQRAYFHYTASTEKQAKQQPRPDVQVAKLKYLIHGGPDGFAVGRTCREVELVEKALATTARNKTNAGCNLFLPQNLGDVSAVKVTYNN